MTDKAALVEAFREHLQVQLDTLLSSQRAAAQGMRVDGEHRPANRGERGAVTAAGYLTQGLQTRVSGLLDDLDLLERVGTAPRERAVTGALVRLDGGRAFFLFPGGSGVQIGPVIVISPQSPVGRALWNREEGDEAALPRGDAEILEIL